ncbi:hypothetical protein NQZ68_025016 [Dissostichus eleginoides]|nr:hypothetical protein NQZ68_025016 [Dissostichus eleginoides]
MRLERFRVKTPGTGAMLARCLLSFCGLLLSVSRPGRRSTWMWRTRLCTPDQMGATSDTLWTFIWLILPEDGLQLCVILVRKKGFSFPQTSWLSLCLQSYTSEYAREGFVPGSSSGFPVSPPPPPYISP